jgi:hypothetical protein
MKDAEPKAEYIYNLEVKAWELYWVLCRFFDITIHHNISNFQTPTKPRSPTKLRLPPKIEIIHTSVF